MRYNAAVLIPLVMIQFASPAYSEKVPPELLERLKAETLEMRRSFDDLYLVSERVKTAEAKIYEGLPHQALDKGQFERELEIKKTVNQSGFHFYLPELEVVPSDLAAFKEIFISSASFTRFKGLKLCGGYHPDFSLRWDSGKKACDTQFCLGCDEARMFIDGKVIYADISEDAAARLKAIFKKYRRQRPQSKRGQGS